MKLSDVKLCNCVDCRRPLLGESQVSWYQSLHAFDQEYVCLKLHIDCISPAVAGRILGRPYCNLCLAVRQKIGSHSVKDDPETSGENAVEI